MTRLQSDERALYDQAADAGEEDKPVVRLVGTDGNVFALIGLVARALRDVGRPKEASEMTRRAFAAHSYGEVLAMFSEYVEVE